MIHIKLIHGCIQFFLEHWALPNSRTPLDPQLQYKSKCAPLWAHLLQTIWNRSEVLLRTTWELEEPFGNLTLGTRGEKKILFIGHPKNNFDCFSSQFSLPLIVHSISMQTYLNKIINFSCMNTHLNKILILIA